MSDNILIGGYALKERERLEQLILSTRDFTTEIWETLKEIEKDHNVTIIYACESGSRAWGFESTDSDYDIRFIYVHNTSWYLTPFAKSDTISFMDKNLDFHGWDIKKALFLLNQSNISLFDWLRSPIVYMKHDAIKIILDNMHHFFDPKIGCYAHYHLMKKTYDEFVRNKSEVSVKKYMYALRSYFNLCWVEKYGTSPPTNINITLAILAPDTKLVALVGKLMEIKKSIVEKQTVLAIPEINNVLEEAIMSRDGGKYKIQFDEIPLDKQLKMDSINEFMINILWDVEVSKLGF